MALRLDLIPASSVLASKTPRQQEEQLLYALLQRELLIFDLDEDPGRGEDSRALGSRALLNFTGTKVFGPGPGAGVFHV